MRTDLDSLRSLQRYVASILPAPWDIRLALEQAPPQRPFALVTQNAPALPIGSFGAHSLRVQSAFTIHAFLPQAVTRLVAELAAAALLETLFVPFKVRGNAPSTRGDVVPLWDFAADVTDGADPPRGYCDYMTIQQFNQRPVPDAADPRLQMVATDLTLAWWRSGSLWDQGQPLTDPGGPPYGGPGKALKHVHVTPEPPADQAP